MVKMDYEEVEGPATEVVVEAQAGGTCPSVVRSDRLVGWTRCAMRCYIVLDVCFSCIPEPAMSWCWCMFQTAMNRGPTTLE
jgi:hypothetical protein